MISFQEKMDFVEACRQDPVFMTENLMFSEDQKPYILEDHQKEFLRCSDPYRMLFWARRLSKSTTLRFDILHKTFFTPSLRAIVMLPSWSQANDFGGEIQDLIQRSPLLDEMFVKQNATTMKLQNGSRINMASAGKEGVGQLGRGARYLAFDEAQQIPDRVFGYILPVMRGTPGKKYQCFSGTPLGKMGMFWEVYNDAKLLVTKNGAKKIVWDDGDDHFVVFERQTAYLDELGEIIESGTKRIQIPELRKDRTFMGEIDFLREFCLNWMDTIGEVFSPELVTPCILDTPAQLSSQEECVAGVDLGKQRHHSVLTVGERGKDDKLKIIFIKSWPLGTEYKDVVKYCFTTLLVKFPNLRKMVVDETGVGKAVVEEFDKYAKGRPLKVEGFNFAGPDKKRGLVEAGVLDMERGRVKFVYNQSLITEMYAYKRVISEKTNKIGYEKERGGSDDFVDSFLLCLAANRGTTGVRGKIAVVGAGQNILNRINPLNKNAQNRLGGINPRVRGRL